MTDRTGPDEAARVRLGARGDTEADVLAELADDPSVTVRATLALNTGAPAPVNSALSSDRDERVRILLARKLAALVPGLSATDQTQLYRETWSTLTALVEDEAVRVRAVHTRRGLSSGCSKTSAHRDRPSTSSAAHQPGRSIRRSQPAQQARRLRRSVKCG